ncbi:Gfo/Idh/MocA family protein [uncultured Clostridium sp.]|uniref:Gfo/Idh/MocA family protein n=1 Tax=uncultured Clostridium sp. TaxID=59620 RepID=UPI00258ED438|nr:Gfo/Idh/MocA family oxidoreductase [uncultured Clostridium sp.]MDU1348245.1 Gfo/Idh/MocA family oxidoreductase [Clostridium argentinense]
MSKIKVGLIGAGQRGKDVYGNYALINPEHIEFVAVAEPNEIKRKEFSEKHNIKAEYQFESWEQLLEKEKFCDAVVIATPDRVHFEPAKLALKRGYHILLEKPMSSIPEEVMNLGALAKENNKVFMICHVLRYTPFFSTIKQIIDSGEIGDIMSIQHNENIGYFHFGHSFVRGNWRNSNLSSSLMLQKSCHDMDILLWLVGSPCRKIASFGELSYFKKERKPEGAGDRCTKCSIEAECPYSAIKLYYNNVGRWPTTAIVEIQTIDEVKKAVDEGPYGRCVYNCDNNVVDHQSTILEFENNVTATFNLSAFTNKVNRTIKIMGTKGEIRAIDSKNEIEVQLFDTNERKVINPKQITGGHGGGDTGIMEDFISLILSNEGKALTSASVSVQSHMMAFAAEESRLKGKVVDIKEYYSNF